MRRYLAVLVLLTGCDFYFGEDDPPPTCGYGGIDGGAALQLRNPETGECQSFGGGYPPCGYYGDDCACPDYAALSPLPDWGECFSACNGLDESTCLATSGCNASYDLLVGIPEEMDSASSFTGCWATSGSEPIQGGGCYNLDSYACSQHDDCALFYDQGSNSYSKFAACAPEPTWQGCAAVDCGPGSHCEEQCYPCDAKDGPCDTSCTPVCVPDYDACLAALCGPGTECITVCDGGGMTTPNGIVPGECYPVCVPVGGGEPGECTGAVACDALPPACPSGTVAGILNGCWTGYCIPQSACGPNEPGGCEPAICATPGPACPSGTVGGTLNGCWTGYCIPESACPLAQCEDLTSESACTSRDDCSAVYTGANCTCDVNGCTCEDLTFARCESQLLMPW